MNPFFADSLLLIILAIWTIPWKIYSVWLAVKHDDKKWFVALLLLNTAGILEIFYIFKVANKSWAEVKGDFNEAIPASKKGHKPADGHHDNHGGGHH